MKKIFISTTSFAEDDSRILDVLKKASMAVTMNPHKRRLNEAEITQILYQGQFDGLLAGLEPLTKNVLVKAKGLKVISRVGVGLDNVDLPAAQKLKIKVFNTPGVLTDAVAELTLSLILALLRKVSYLDRKMHSGVWEKQYGSLLKGKTVGIIGFGSIGQRVADLLKVFGAKVIFTDVLKVKKTGVKQASLAEILKTADIISMHSSGKDCLIGRSEMALLKSGAMIVNTARGNLIDEKALLEAVRSGQLAGVALDVFGQEPYDGDLINEDKVILTPHIGSYAKEARVLMERMAVDHLIKGLKGR